MVPLSLKALIDCLSQNCKQALTRAAQSCIERGALEIKPEHLLLALLDEPTHDLNTLLRYFESDASVLRKSLQQVIESEKTRLSERPVYSPLLIEWLQQTWLLSSVEYQHVEIRSAVLCLALKLNERLLPYEITQALACVKTGLLKDELVSITEGSDEPCRTLRLTDATGGATEASDGVAVNTGLAEPLVQFTQDFTEKARSGKIDPVFCRDAEIRQVIDILGRRRKNNPLAVGEPGVGKTALVEGLALQIVAEAVPESLKGVALLSLDLQALQAGASVKGEFEKRLKSVIDAVKTSPQPIVLFIDEVHTLIGAGGQAGTGDAANILKPALARGEIRTIAATTWSEYKKYIEKDAALERRFQPVKLAEPSVEQATVILRGLSKIYEASHGVFIRDDALVAAAQLSARYLTGRRLPDKAVDVLDTVCSRIKLSLEVPPADLEVKQRQIQQLQREQRSLHRESELGLSEHESRKIEIEHALSLIEAQADELEQQWCREKAVAIKIVEGRKKWAQNQADASSTDIKNPSDAIVKTDLVEQIAQLKSVQDGKPLVYYEACPELVAQVISDWTGIPLGNMLKDEAQSILQFKDNLSKRIKGQQIALQLLDRGLRPAKAGISNPKAPLGVFLLVGPSGVGKTEAAQAIADLLFGGERFLTTFNMSEFMDKHSNAKLIGSAPGLVGYGEGGALTEAVRQNPYSVILLDEVEKAHPEVMNLFYQVFDQGNLADGESRIIDFKNTVILMTSNLASEEILAQIGQQRAGGDTEEAIEAFSSELIEKIRPTLNQFFKPALVGRMQVVPFMPLESDVLSDIVQLKLDKLVQRLRESHDVELKYSPDVIAAVTHRCQVVETGARTIDMIIRNHLLPEIATRLLVTLDESKAPKILQLGWSDGFTYEFTA